MEKINLSKSDDLLSAINKIKRSDANNLEVFIPEGSEFGENILNLKILEKEAIKLGKKISFGGGKVLSGPEHGHPPRAQGTEFVEGDILEHTDPSHDRKAEEKLLTADIFARVWNKLGKSWKGKKRLSYVIAGSSVLVILAVLFALIWFLPSAKVSLVVNSEVLVKSIGVVLTPDSEELLNKEEESSLEVDEEQVKEQAPKQKNILSAILVEVLETKIQGTKATGKKIVGEKAGGTVTIKNWTDKANTFREGDIITSAERINGERLNFLLTSDVSVPPQTATVSATPDTKTKVFKPGTAEVGVVAENVGGKYNLEKGTLFTLGELSLDDFEVVAATVIDGGSSREVTVVTKEDQDKLLNALYEVLKEKAKKDLESKLVGDQKMHSGAIKYEIIDKKYSREISDEADDFSLTLEIKAEALVYSEDKLNELLDGVLSGFIPDGFEISNRDREIKVDVLRPLGESSGEPDPSDSYTAEIQVKVRSYVLPKIDPDYIARSLVGLRIQSASEFLSSIPNIESYKIKMWPPLPAFLQTMPRSKGRINVEVVRK